jgi:hypothetical protein
MFGLKMGELLVIALTFGVLVVPVLFLRAWAKTLRLATAHQEMSPGLVWLMLIPGFNLVWQFFLLRAATKGIKGRFTELGRHPGDGGFGVGLAYQILALLYLASSAAMPTDVGRGMAGASWLGALVTWLIYWWRITGFNRQMESLRRAPVAAAG